MTIIGVRGAVLFVPQFLVQPAFFSEVRPTPRWTAGLPQRNVVIIVAGFYRPSRRSTNQRCRSTQGNLKHGRRLLKIAHQASFFLDPPT